MRVVFYLFLLALATHDAYILTSSNKIAFRGRSFALSMSLRRGDARGAALVVENASVYRGSAKILSSIHWRVEPNAKWAIVGTNGCGKSSLLKALVGDVDVDDGDIVISTTQQVGYLQQTAVAGSNKTIYEEASSAMKDIVDARTALEQAQKAVEEDASQINLKKLDSASQRFEAVGGYTQEQTVSSVLKGLGFTDMQQRCDELSGGWQMRVALGRLLLSCPTLLLLDEPSNHLDQSARTWLAKYLKNYEQGAMILVTHDVTLLESVNHIAEISGGTLETYKSSTYQQYLEEKQRRKDAAVAELERNQQKAAKLQGFVDRFGASATKASAAQSRVKQLEKMKRQGLLDAPTTNAHNGRFQPSLVLPDPPQVIGESLLSLKGASVGYATDQPLVTHIDFNVQKGMKVLLRGPNGAGKSTILAALRGTLDLLEGERIESPQLRLGMFTQDLAQELDVNARAVDLVLQHAREGNPTLSDEEARACMGRLGLSGGKSLQKIGELSGGEKARVALCMFGLKPHNLLVLDEASNHLDQECIQALSEALYEWEGTYLVVSHDFAFCQSLGEFTHVATVSDGKFVLEERSMRPSDWSQFETASNGKSSSVVVNGDSPISKPAQELDRKLQKQAYNAPKRIEKLEQMMEEMEIQVAAIDDEMLLHGSDVEKLLELTSKRDSLQSKIDEYMKEWEELEEVLLKV